MKKKRPYDNTFVFRLIRRFTVFLALFVAVLLSLYLSGNFQQFLDSTQRFILLFCSIACAMLAFFSIAGLLDSVVMLCLNREARYAGSFFIYALFLVLSASVLLVLRIVSSLSLGLR